MPEDNSSGFVGIGRDLLTFCTKRAVQFAESGKIVTLSNAIFSIVKAGPPEKAYTEIMKTPKGA